MLHLLCPSSSVSGFLKASNTYLILSTEGVTATTRIQFSRECGDASAVKGLALTCFQSWSLDYQKPNVCGMPASDDRIGIPREGRLAGPAVLVSSGLS